MKAVYDSFVISSGTRNLQRPLTSLCSFEVTKSMTSRSCEPSLSRRNEVEAEARLIRLRATARHIREKRNEVSQTESVLPAHPMRGQQTTRAFSNASCEGQ